MYLCGSNPIGGNIIPHDCHNPCEGNTLEDKNNWEAFNIGMRGCLDQLLRCLIHDRPYVKTNLGYEEKYLYHPLFIHITKFDSYLDLHSYSLHIFNPISDTITTFTRGEVWNIGA